MIKVNGLYLIVGKHILVQFGVSLGLIRNSVKSWRHALSIAQHPSGKKLLEKK